MNITINGKSIEISDNIKTVKDLVAEKNISSAGTAIALNSKLVKADCWETTLLNDNDNIIIISGAYGG